MNGFQFQSASRCELRKYMHLKCRGNRNFFAKFNRFARAKKMKNALTGLKGKMIGRKVGTHIRHYNTKRFAITDFSSNKN